ncbi:hypothetical protein SAMN04488072_1046 [Lentibacillus halodurans]|uniref:HTH cro/C1-type domain-containing protein n=1 Tax=Lentibacillus halodurans TaxID=237679 RepID=A0A1I0WY22_9BACI|nr:helix-turn-helix transcriptional regulator [Lentibacillus halodurans]SFA93639.1 hypothetical protein SAMN04488072_1046 [Lentibacillus halodurans]
MKPVMITSLEFDLLKNSPIGERVRLLRNKLMNDVDEAFYTANAISKRTGIAAQTITSIERGESKKPSFSVIHSLAKDFYVPIEVFTDEYYEISEKLFSVGKPEEPIDITDLNLDDYDSLIIGDKEYFTSDFDNEERLWQHRRNISFIVYETTVDEGKKLLYKHSKHMKEMEMTNAISQLIHLIELSPQELSSSEWNEAIKRSPLAEAHKIISEPIKRLPTVQFTIEDKNNKGRGEI